MPIKQTQGARPNSAANSLPGAPNSAAGGLEKITPKTLIYCLFPTPDGMISSAEAGFSLSAGNCARISPTLSGGPRPHTKVTAGPMPTR
jgi:hypothetical protein